MGKKVSIPPKKVVRGERSRSIHLAGKRRNLVIAAAKDIEAPAISAWLVPDAPSIAGAYDFDAVV
jgi:hypothetical protein